MTTLEKLKAEFPNISITTKWEVDHDYEWNGEGPDPHHRLPHNVIVTASRIEAGELIQRHAYLGGCYALPHFSNPEIQGYFEDLAREAIHDLIGSTIKTLPAPFDTWKFDLSNGCLHHPCECLTRWTRKNPPQEWAQGAEMLPEFATNTLKP